MSSIHMVRACLAVTGAAILGGLAACSSVPGRPGAAPVEQRSLTTTATTAASAPDQPAATEVGSAAPAATSPAAGTAPGLASPAPSGLGAAAPGAKAGRARWERADWADLPGFSQDRAAQLWPALRAACTRPAAGWAETCARALLEPPAADDEAVRRWLMTQLQPWRVLASDGQAQGLATGYFEPELNAARRPQGSYRVPLYAAPPALLAQPAPRQPWYTRQQLDTVAAARAALQGQEIAYVESPLDALLLQVQGSGRLRVSEPDGRISRVRLAFAAHNEQPYRSLGRWLIEQGELSSEQASWPAIKSWAQRNPKRLQELLWANPRVVFFREEPLGDPEVGASGAQGVPLSPGRSVAVDPLAVPLGAVLWIDTTEPLGNTPLRRLVMAQDTGSAITGAVRADLFFGWHPSAEALAGRMRQALRWWVLWPRGLSPMAMR